MNGKRLSIIFISIIALAGVGFLIAYFSQRAKTGIPVDTGQIEQGKEGVTPTVNLTPQKGVLRTGSSTWQLDEQYEVTVEYDQLPSRVPVAYTLQILYDPSVLRIDDIEVGNLWTGSNVLEEKINKETGVAMFSAGQGFEDKITNNKLLATLKVTVLKADEENTETSIRLGPESATASDGKNLIKLEIPSVVIKLSK